MKGVSEMSFNHHHILWPRKKWAKGYAGKLRCFWYLRPLIPADTLHRHIHENMIGIPRSNELLCQSALEQLKTLDERKLLHKEDSLRLRLELLICLLDTGDSPTAEALRQQLRLVDSYAPL